MASYVTVSRKWNRPRIYHQITFDELEYSMSLEDFFEALMIELGNPATIVTRKRLEERMKKAFVDIADGIKAESNKTAGKKP